MKHKQGERRVANTLDVQQKSGGMELRAALADVPGFLKHVCGYWPQHSLHHGKMLFAVVRLQQGTN